MAYLSSRVVLLTFLYFIQGLPYGLQARFLPVYLRTKGLSLTSLGFFKMLLAPWLCKALWAPLVDKYATKRKWLLYSIVGLMGTCAVTSMIPPDNLYLLCVSIFSLNLFAATQDIAVDSIALTILPPDELGRGNTAQVVGYKIGAIFGGGILVWFMDVLGWMGLFLALTLLYVEALLFVYLSPTLRVYSRLSQSKREPEKHRKTAKEVENQPKTNYDDIKKQTDTSKDPIIQEPIKTFTLLEKEEEDNLSKLLKNALDFIETKDDLEKDLELTHELKVEALETEDREEVVKQILGHLQGQDVSQSEPDSIKQPNGKPPGKSDHSISKTDLNSPTYNTEEGDKDSPVTPPKYDGIEETPVNKQDDGIREEATTIEETPKKETPTIEETPRKETPNIEATPSIETPNIEETPSKEAPNMEETSNIEETPKKETPSTEETTRKEAPSREETPTVPLENTEPEGVELGYMDDSEDENLSGDKESEESSSQISPSPKVSEEDQEEDVLIDERTEVVGGEEELEELFVEEDEVEEDGSDTHSQDSFTCSSVRVSGPFAFLWEVFTVPNTGWIAVYVLIYKLGEQGALGMLPLFLVDQEVKPVDVTFWTGVVGQATSMVGSCLGGWLLSHPVYRLPCRLLIYQLSLCRLLPLGLLLWVVLLWSSAVLSPTLLYRGAIVAMNLLLVVSGMVTTATFTLMMECSQSAPRAVQATHYTLLSSMEVFGKLTFMSVCGALVDYFGYTTMYLSFVVLSAALLPWLWRYPDILCEKKLS